MSTEQPKLVSLYQAETEPPVVLGIHDSQEEAIKIIVKDIVADMHNHPSYYIPVYQKCEYHGQSLEGYLENCLSEHESFFHDDGAHNWYISKLGH